ncbi:hypothetical protein GGP91_001970 [Salinibacter ruber]|uniref:Uncharacterized protein n=1 Tax=Salinibacter ruber TaxID=146919 RepID=A0A9X2U754_9BACT|nr:hypothetical protein [Salinibacter ruber]MBB4089791.1 hypothetical protein [Salinibacter ruber]MCS3610291.1 hypothetical protein [Salinibacter ruber]MCS3614910.1 hypothetical protein [Salinibacter ruber]MCS3631216.1 hypothetical protein [Salinibacter ruber]MCS3640918.1 hypothetical protein [Salinibacter ruber]
MTDWFCVVDRAPTTTEGQCTLTDGSVVLTLSATRADAVAVADLAGIGIVRYAHLSDPDRAALRRHLAPYRQVDG